MSASQWKQQPNPGSSRRGPRQLLRKTWVRLTSFVAHGNAKSQAQPDLAYEFFKDCVNSDSGSPLKTPRTSTSTTSSMDSGGSSENTSSSSMRNRRRTVPIDPDLDEDGNRTSDDSTGSSDDTTGLPSLARSHSGSSNVSPSMSQYQSFSNIYALIDEMIQEQDRVMQETGRYPEGDEASFASSIFTTATPLCIFDDGSVSIGESKSIRATVVPHSSPTPVKVRSFEDKEVEAATPCVNRTWEEEVWGVYLTELQEAEADSADGYEENDDYKGKRVPLPLISAEDINSSLEEDVPVSVLLHELQCPKMSPGARQYSWAEC